MDLFMIFVFFIYGLAFFILGFAIILYPKKDSAIKLAKGLWLIGAFGILHGLNEWLDMFILIQQPGEILLLNIIRAALLPLSFLFLVYFGVRTLSETKERYSKFKALPTILFIVWGVITAFSSNRFVMGDIWARYLLAIPGVLLTSYALNLQIPEFKKTVKPEVIVNLKIASGTFLIYAFFSGFIVQQANFFPASLLNYTTFLDFVGVPVQVFRSIIALSLTYNMIRLLSIFELETLEALQTAHVEMKSEIAERKQVEEEQRLLQKINNMLNAGVDQEEVFKELVDGIRSLYNYESVAIHIMSEDKTYLIIKGYSADSKIAKRLEKLTGLTVMDYKVALYVGSLFQEVVDTGKPVIADDIKWVLNSYGGKKYPQSLVKIAAKLTKAKWGIGVPLLAGDKFVGVIGCGSTYELTDKDSQRFAVFGAQAGLAIEKAQTFNVLETAYDELNKSNKLKDLFIDIMRHDLLNPAGVARGLAELALDGEKDPDKKELLQAILRSDERIIEMIENASTLSKLEEGRELELKPGDLRPKLEEAIETMAELAKGKNTKIKFQSKGKYPALINPLIRDLFQNIISNAIKYGPDNSNVAIKIEDDGMEWKVSVADKGEGIPDEHKESIFERFTRIEKGIVKGTGLGLAISKKVTEVHNGRVWVEDNPSGGSIFYIAIPKRKD